MVRGGGGRLRRAGEIIAALLLHIILVGIIAVVVLTLTTRDFGLLLAAIALTMIFFFEWVFRHNVRVGRISEGRARAVRVLMLPWVYLAALGLSIPFLDAPGVDPVARLAVIGGFVVLTFSVAVWGIVIARRMNRTRRVRTPSELPRIR